MMLIALCSCSDGPAKVPAAATSTGPTSSVSSTSKPMLGAGQDEEANRVIGAASAQSRVVVERASGVLVLKPIEAACVVGRLDAAPDLRGRVGDDPVRSPAFQELSDLAADCVRRTTGALGFANGVQEQAAGTLSVEQLECLRDAYAALSPGDLGDIVRSGLVPASPVPGAAARLAELMAGCGVSRSDLGLN